MPEINSPLLAILSGILLLRLSPWGYLLASVSVLKFITMGLSVSTMSVNVALTGIAESLGIMVPFLSITLVFVIAAILLMRNRALGIAGIPSMFILGVGILSPIALGELLAPVRYGRPIDVGEFWLFAILSLVFLIFTAVYLVTLKPRMIARKN